MEVLVLLDEEVAEAHPWDPKGPLHLEMEPDPIERYSVTGAWPWCGCCHILDEEVAEAHPWDPKGPLHLEMEPDPILT